MGDLKELFISISDRIRTPIFLPLIFSFISINWQPIFYLLFSDEAIKSKFDYFDAKTCIGTLIIVPFFIAVLYVIISPYFYHLIFKATKNSRSALKKDKIKEATDITNYRNELSDALIKQRQATEVDIVEKAVLDQRVESEISDPVKKEQVKSKIKEVRKVADEKVGSIEVSIEQKPTPKKTKNNSNQIDWPKLNLYKNEDIKLSESQKAELSLLINAMLKALDDNFMPPFRFSIEGYGKRTQYVDILVDGAKVEIGGHASGATDLIVKKETFFALVSGEITFTYATKNDLIQSYGSIKAFPYLDSYFKKVSQHYQH